MSTWSHGKSTRVLLLLALILALTASFLTFDWTQYAFGLVRIADPERLYTRITKTLASFLVFLLALSVGEDGINRRDPNKLRACFVAIFSGDLLFLLDEFSPYFDYVAILMFLLGHVLVILRNGQGLHAHFQHKQKPGDYIIDIASAVGILLFTFLLFWLTLLEHLRGDPLLYILIVYALVLDASLWTGLVALRAGYFPRSNALMIAIGATCFFIGDYLVGFNLSLEPSLQRAVTLFLTWVFYTPAISLFALSGYRWNSSA